MKNIRFPTVRREMTTKEKVWWLIRKNKANTMSEIAKVLNKRKSTIHQHLSELLDQEIIRIKKRQGKEKFYFTRHKTLW